MEELGFSTLWLTGGPLPGLHTITDVIRATSTLQVASGILSVDRYDAGDVAALYAKHPDRFLVGIGGAHGPHRSAPSTRTSTSWTPYPPTAASWPRSARACSSSPATAPPAPSRS